MKPTSADLTLQAHAPLEIVPLFGVFEALKKVGHRFLVAKDGLWLEAKTPWVHVTWPIAQSRKVPIPAGELTKNVRLAFDKVPAGMLKKFVEMAMDASPNEIGAVVLWNEQTDQFELVATRTIRSGIGHLKYARPEVGQHEHVVMDLHSHGPIRAYFSKTDVADTGAEVVIAAVVGNVEKSVDVKVCLFACGLQIPVEWPESNEIGEGAELEEAWVVG
jgi:PRTRC genetic system protein A